MIIGYGFCYGGANGLLYRVGKTYTFKGELKNRNHGFIFYKSLEEFFKENSLIESMSVFEFEILGDIVSIGNILHLTNQIKVVRLVPYDECKKISMESFYPFYEYDDNGNIIHEKEKNGYEVWREYNENENLLHEWDNEGWDVKMEYNSNGVMIHLINSNGVEERCNDAGYVIYKKNVNGVEYRCEYDKYNNRVHFKDSSGYEEWYEYDETGKKILLTKNSSGCESRYDLSGYLTYKKSISGFEEWYEYNELGERIGYRNSDGDNWTIDIS